VLKNSANSAFFFFFYKAGFLVEDIFLLFLCIYYGFLVSTGLTVCVDDLVRPTPPKTIFDPGKKP